MLKGFKYVGNTILGYRLVVVRSGIKEISGYNQKNSTNKQKVYSKSIKNNK